MPALMLLPLRTLSPIRLLPLLFALLVVAWGGGALSTPAVAKELAIGITQFPSTFHPNIDSMMAKTYVLGMTQRPLTTYDQSWEGTCLLCTEMPTFENGLAVKENLPDGGEGVALTYKIQPKATWGDGTPVTSADAVFTWEVGRHPESGVSNAELYRRILAVDVIDDKTFVLHVDRISFDYGLVNDFNLLPAHIEQPIFEAGPAQYRQRTAFDSDPTNSGLAFGPYRIDRVVSGSEIALVPNETWWGTAPTFDRVTIKVIENTSALEANLLSGAIDMVAGELGLNIDQALAFEKRHGERFDIEYESGLIYEHIDLNLDNPVLQDKRMRQALIQSIDREAISAQLFQGRQPVAHGSVSPLDWVHSETAARYPFDPEKAASLLDEMGWTDIRDGVRHNADGEPLTFEIMTTAGNRTRELVQQVLQSQWRNLGIDVRVRNEPARVFFGQTVSQRNFPAMAMFAWISSPENVPRTVLHSDAIPTAENNWAGQNYTGYNNPEMDLLLEEIEVELDREKRKELWQRLQEIYAEDLPVIPLYWRANSHIRPDWLTGVRPTGHQAPTSLWVEEWGHEDP
ncbi:MAG: peptide ABC transporter substrate-binding protein [Pseudomonadota bacterium]